VIAGLRVLAQILVCSIIAAAFARPALAQESAAKTYACQGFAEPLQHSPMQVAKGRVLPLRAKLATPGGGYVDDRILKTSPVVSLKFKPESGPEVDRSAGVEVRDYGKGTHFVWDDEAHWKFDLGTKSLPDDEGEYTVSVASGDEKEYKIDPTCSLVFHVRGGGGP